MAKVQRNSSWLSLLAKQGIFLVASFCTFQMAHGAELQVYTTRVVSPALQTVTAEFQRESGHTIKFTFDTEGGLRKQVAAGAPADVVVLSSVEAAELDRQGLVASPVEVGSRWLAVAVKPGTSRPRIGTAAELRETLLNAKSVTYGRGHAGVHFSKVVLTRLGILEQVQSKTVLTADGPEAVRRVANGESEIAIVQASEIFALPIVELVGPLPKDLQMETPYAAVALKASKIPEVAHAFIKHLVSPSGKSAFQAAGFEPSSGR